MVIIDFNLFTGRAIEELANSHMKVWMCLRYFPYLCHSIFLYRSLLQGRIIITVTISLSYILLALVLHCTFMFILNQKTYHISILLDIDIIAYDFELRRIEEEKKIKKQHAQIKLARSVLDHCRNFRDYHKINRYRIT